MTSADSDCNLLFGILALQLDFISRDQLIEAMQAWVLDKARFLDVILRDNQFLTEEQHQLLSALVAEHLRKHGGDPEASLASLSSLGSVRNELSRIEDAQLQKSLAVVSSQQTFSLQEGDSATSTGVGAFNLSGPRFRILRPHDEGGLGKVSVALDQELNREVALKEIKSKYAADHASRTRFVLEAEITGGLEHPGIVPVYGLGHYADGRPYYAMRFIRGDSLRKAIKDYHETDWSKRDPADRTVQLRRLLGRFLDVCHAVHYAHRRGVLHRDLKPGNIMLGEYGETLVVDWGLAKALGKHEDRAESRLSAETTLLPRSGSGMEPTRLGAVMGSPPYMSPEQARGEHDQLGTATDVYSLGATLYTLLTNAAPIEGESGEEVVTKIRQGQWQRPRQLNRDVSRALEAICVKAMAVEPADRYPTARALAEDVERYLADEPVTAHREPWFDRVSRLGRRYQTLVRTAAAALALVTVVAVAAAVAINHQRNNAVAARQESDKAKARAERVLDVLVKSFRRPDPSVDGRGVTVASVLDQATSEVDKFNDSPEDQTALLDALAKTYQGLGIYAKGIPLFEKSLEIRQSSLGNEHADTLTSMNNLATGYINAGQLDKALPLLEKTLELRRVTLGLEYPDTETLMNNLALGYRAAGHFDKAILLLENTLEQFRASLGNDHRETLMSMNNLAMTYLDAGQMEKAIHLFQATLDSKRASLADDHPSTLTSMNNLALAYAAAGRLDKALPLFEKTLELRCTKLGLEHPSTLTSMNNLAVGYRTLGQTSKALPLLEKTLELRRAKLGLEHPDTLMTMNNLALTRLEAADLEHAIPLLEETLAVRRAKLGDDHSMTLGSMNNLALGYRDAGQFDKALMLFEVTLQLGRAKLGRDHPSTLAFMNNLALTHLDAGELEKAIPLFEETFTLRRAKLGDDHPDTLKTSRSLACALLIAGRSEVDQLQDYLKRERQRLVDGDPRLGNILVEVSENILRAERFVTAERLLREALELCSVADDDELRTAYVQSLLGGALVGQKKYSEAEPLLIRGYDGMKQREKSIPRPLPQQLHAAARRLVEFYTARGKLEEAAKWQIELERANARVEELRQLATDAGSTAPEPEEPGEPAK